MHAYDGGGEKNMCGRPASCVPAVPHQGQLRSETSPDCRVRTDALCSLPPLSGDAALKPAVPAAAAAVASLRLVLSVLSRPGANSASICLSSFCTAAWTLSVAGLDERHQNVQTSERTYRHGLGHQHVACHRRKDTHRAACTHPTAGNRSLDWMCKLQHLNCCELEVPCSHRGATHREGGPLSRCMAHAAHAQVHQEGARMLGPLQLLALEAHRAHNLHMPQPVSK